MARQTSPTKIHPDNYADAILTADNHLSPRVPRCREPEEFVTAMLGKLDFIADLQRQHKGIPVLCAGDVTDRWFLDKGEQWFVTEIIKRMHNWIAVPGQHDLPQHNLELYDKSLLALLEEAGCIFTGNFVETNLAFRTVGFPWRAIPGGPDVGCSQGVPIVALVHRMTYPSKPPYPGAENDGGTARELMRKMKGFDLIVTGDNHETFVMDGDDHELEYNDTPGGATYHGGRLLVNPGSMMRTSAKQIDHKPSVFLWWAGDNRVERVVLPHEKGVVSREHIDRVEARDERMEAFVERLAGKVDLSVGFRENVLARLREAEVDDETEKIVMEVLG